MENGLHSPEGARLGMVQVLDDYSRYILACKLGRTMASKDVQETLELALAATNLKQVKVRHRPRLRSDNGPCYVSWELEQYLRHRTHPRRSLSSDRKIERFTILAQGYRSMKNVIRLQNYYPWVLERAIRKFVDYYNNHRYHEALDGMTPADVYFGRVEQVKSRLERIKEATMRQRRELNSRTPSLRHAAAPGQGQSISY